MIMKAIITTIALVTREMSQEVNEHSKRRESPTVTLTWHANKDMGHYLYLSYLHDPQVHGSSIFLLLY